MKHSIVSVIRDLGLLALLLFLGKTAFNKMSSHIKEHTKSFIHELDRTFLDQIHLTKRQIHQLEEYDSASDIINLDLTHLKSRLALIEDQYKTNSPAIMLLGPIGSAAIVSKEEKLEKKLLSLLNDLSALLTSIAQEENREVAITIDNALETNKRLLRKIAASQ